MLHFIREHSQGWLAWIIVSLISIPFALWGINSYMGGSGELAVAFVNDEEVTQTEFQQAMQQYRERMRSMLGKNFDFKLFDNIKIKRSVLNGLIEQKLLLSSSNLLGQTISDTALSKIIQSTPEFQKDGNFDYEYYGSVLARMELSRASFERQLRNNMLNQELIDNIQQTAIITKSNVNTVLKLKMQSRDIAYGVISVQEQLESIDISDEDMKKYFNKYRKNYLLPERVAVDYIELSMDQLKKAVTIDEEVLGRFYVDNQERFTGSVQRRVSHILIKESNNDPRALATINIITQRLNDGEYFTNLAKEFSEDNESSYKGGDLGVIKHGQFDPVFEDALFMLQGIGDISDLVHTKFGYHLIQLTEIGAGEWQSFYDVRAKVESLYRYQEAEKSFYEKVDQLTDLSYEHPESLSIPSEELEIEIKTTDAFTRDGFDIGIMNNENLVKIAFSDDVLVDNLNSSVMEISKSHLIVIRKNQYFPASPMSYEVIAPEIKELLIFEKASNRASAVGKNIIIQSKLGVMIEPFFATNNWHTTRVYSRGNKEISSQILDRAFSISKPTGANEPEYYGFKATNGNYIIIKLTAVHHGNPNYVTDKEFEDLRSNLSRVSGRSEVEAFIDSLKTTATIDIFSQNMH